MDAITDLLRSLGDAWDAGDADAVGRHFTVDADFVDVLGRLQQGRATIVDEHRTLFATIYAGSACTFREIDRHDLADEAVLIHSASLLRAPDGPRRGDTHATQTLLVQGGLIRAFHNTVQAPMERFTGEQDGFGAAEHLDGGASGPRDPRLAGGNARVTP